MQTFVLQPKRVKPGSEPGEPLSLTWNVVDGLSLTFTVTEKSIVTLSGHVGVQNEAKDPDSSNAMVGLDVHMDGKSVPGFMRTTNLNRPRHYEDIPVTGFIIVEPGTHCLEILAMKKNFGNTVPLYIKAPQYSGVFVKVEDFS
jgi:hypothetical protein